MRQKKKNMRIVSLIMSLLFLIYPILGGTSVRIQDDFYEAVNRSWLNAEKIKPGYVEQSTFTELSDLADQGIQDIFKTLLQKHQRNELTDTEKKMVVCYENILDESSRNEQGIGPVEPYLEKIRGAKTTQELTEVLADEKISIMNGLVDFQVSPDLKDSRRYALEIGSAHLLLGDPDAYTKPSKEDLEKKQNLEAYLEEILRLSGYTKEEARTKINQAFLFENKIAPSMWGQEAVLKETHLFEKIYNVYTLEQLEEMTPHFQMNHFIKAQGYEKANKIILQEPKWLAQMDAIYTEENLPLIKDYLEVHILKSCSPYLSMAFDKANKNYIEEVYGVIGELPKEQEALEQVGDLFADELGKLYVANYFSEAAKKDVEQLVEDIIGNYEKRLKKLEWMSKKTKKKAIKKLRAMTVKVGYPKKWEDYEQLVIRSYKEGGSVLDNILEAACFSRQRQAQKLQETVDKKAFALPVQTVNAVYSPSNNDITFPAAILQAPLYDVNQSKEANLGGIGAVIAHEITHAFDPIGSKFDAKGNLEEWWTKADYEKFEQKTQAVKDFYSKIEFVPGHFVNGELTVGENIADIGAIANTLEIVSSLEEPKYEDFFENWARTWRLLATPQYEMEKLKTDEHAPHKVRVNAVLSQFEPFYEVYKIKEMDKMYVPPEERLEIW